MNRVDDLHEFDWLVNMFKTWPIEKIMEQSAVRGEESSRHSDFLTHSYVFGFCREADRK